tara:strand:+ start:46 stop:1149 length:1104 start_codon:yes stop_codon:yes gene_type:complete
MITVAISLSNHDLSITILKNEKLITILEEDRASRIKHDGIFPLKSIFKIKNFTTYIDELVLINIPLLYDIIIEFLQKEKIKIKKITKYPNTYHHIFHASSGFYGSGFKDATCLTIDSYGGNFIIDPIYDKEGKGVHTTNIYQVTSTSNFVLKYANIFYNPTVTTPYDIDFLSFNKNIEINNSLDIGMIYDAISRYVGFNTLEAGKTMGLSSYGKNNPLIPPFLYKDTVYSNMNLFKGNRSLNIKLNPEIINNPSIPSQDLAYKAQQTLEEVFIKRIKQSLSLSPNNNIVISGGCALNVVNNYKLKKKFPHINFYFDPIGGDIGQSYGAAKYHYYQLTNSLKLESLKHLYHGPRYSKEDLLNSIKKYV